MSVVAVATSGQGQKSNDANLLPEPVARRSITEAQWRTLCNSLFPGANPQSVLLVWDYCVARRLDPLKKPCHIVPMEVKDRKTGKYEWCDVVMPGIYEHRTIAQRTGEHLGHSKPEYGPEASIFGIKAPEWAEYIIYRWNSNAHVRAEFPVRVYFREVVATTGDGRANSRWARAPIQMLVKCLEAAALREAFPDELGGQQTAEEMEGQRAIDMILPIGDNKPLPTKPPGFDDWAADLTATADAGKEQLASLWKTSKPSFREYLTLAEPGTWELLKARAAMVADAAQSQSTITND